ncbi:hypothetical protein MANES_06G056433v8 [Manihot esculenta]|uniref:Uncharacterized protein n=1 Tax=Manihot esculenta TaxID=3983 RepID=A0ACB7HHH9_MANES|nr:hypothetical protein MANES_06G056433v8 [Manihot esculenta]
MKDLEETLKIEGGTVETHLGRQWERKSSPHVRTPAFKKTNTVLQVEQSSTWMTPYLRYLEEGKLPEDKDEARKIAARAANYQAIRGTLYRKGKSSPWLRCVSPEEAAKVMEEIHRGLCGAHEGAGTLANKIFRHGLSEGATYVRDLPTPSEPPPLLKRAYPVHGLSHNGESTSWDLSPRLRGKGNL